MLLLTTVTFIAVMAAAMIYDVRANRIPNRLIVVGFVLALVVQALSGFGALSSATLGAGLALAIAFPLFAMGAFGGGDAKLFMVVGAFMGPIGFLYALLASAIVGGLLAIVVAVRRGALLPVLLGSRDLVVRAITGGRSGGRPTLGDRGAITVPYGAAIALGSIATWFLLPRGV